MQQSNNFSATNSDSNYQQQNNKMKDSAQSEYYHRTVKIKNSSQNPSPRLSVLPTGGGVVVMPEQQR